MTSEMTDVEFTRLKANISSGLINIASQVTSAENIEEIKEAFEEGKRLISRDIESFKIVIFEPKKRNEAQKFDEMTIG